MRRVPLWLTGLIVVLAVAACGAGGDHPAPAASHAGPTGRGNAGQAAGVSPGWRVVQALPSEPGIGQPGGGSNEMVSVAAAGAGDVWAVGDLCPQQCATSESTLVEHWAGAGWRTIPPPPGRGPLIPPTVISASSAANVWVFGDTVATTTLVSRWNGSRWRTLRFPPLPPAVAARAEIGNAAIQAYSARDAWVDIGLTTATASYGIIVWHWNGQAWSKVPVPYRTQADGAISGDGRGGIWMYAIGLPAPAGAGTYLYHYSSGRWSRQPAPALSGVATEMGVLSWRPGANSGWAAASTGNRGALLRYFP
jgi:hypothetical protein